MLDFAKNYFALFGLPESFTLDIPLLTKRYLALQQQAHPDRHATASPQVLRVAMQEASFLNEALRTLKDPLARAAYLLSLRGIPPQQHAPAIDDADFLLEQMELQEAIGTFKEQPDPHQAIVAIKAQIAEQINSLLQVLTAALDKNSLETAQDALRKLQFLEKSRRTAADAEASLDDL